MVILSQHSGQKDSINPIKSVKIPADWIKKILQVVKDNPQHTFQFLTKNPERYLPFHFPENCWLGTTVTSEKDSFRLEPLRQKGNFTFVSFEPLLGDVSLLNLTKIDLVIIGAMTGLGAVKPE